MRSGQLSRCVYTTIGLSVRSETSNNLIKDNVLQIPTSIVTRCYVSLCVWNDRHQSCRLFPCSCRFWSTRVPTRSSLVGRPECRWRVSVERGRSVSLVRRYWRLSLETDRPFGSEDLPAYNCAQRRDDSAHENWRYGRLLGRLRHQGMFRAYSLARRDGCPPPAWVTTYSERDGQDQPAF